MKNNKQTALKRYSRWVVTDGEITSGNSSEAIVKRILSARGLKNKEQIEEFMNPKDPLDINLKELAIDGRSVRRAIARILYAKKNKQKIIVYGDYDADGICATAILWEALYALGLDALPYIPERFSEGYGLNGESIEKIKKEDKKVKLIISVDNGIVAHDGIKVANKLGIDVIITDHHEKGEKYPNAFSVIHTTKLSGSGVAWIFAREIIKKFKIQNSKFKIDDGLELAAVGTIADQLPLLGANRSIAKHGLAKLNQTSRPGLSELFEIAGVTKGTIGTYEINFLISPRLNAMGRLHHAIESLRLICTRDRLKARELAKHLDEVNRNRQKIVDDVLNDSRSMLTKFEDDQSIIVISGKKYHEGVIGLAASKIAEEFYKPTIVLSQGKIISKASARSIPGFNIIEAIRKLDNLIIKGGGHAMAAGFSIKTEFIKTFQKEINNVSKKLLTSELLEKKLIIDAEIDCDLINGSLYDILARFEPCGIGNKKPLFITRGVNIKEVRLVGKDSRHLKFKLENNNKIINAIAFGFGEFYYLFKPFTKLNLVYNIEQNTWNDQINLELRIKDIEII